MTSPTLALLLSAALPAVAYAAPPTLAPFRIQGDHLQVLRLTRAGDRLVFQGATPIDGGYAPGVWITSRTADRAGRLEISGGQPIHGYQLIGATARKVFARGVTPDGWQAVYSYDLGYGTTELITRAADPNSALTTQDALFFLVNTPPRPGLYRSDGTASGTKLVYPKPFSDLAALGRNVLFRGVPDGGLYVAGPGGSRRLAPGPIVDLQSFGRRAFFQKGWGDAWEIWTTDGTLHGTRRLLSTSRPMQSASSCMGRFLFALPRAGPGEPSELWVSDGSVSGTKALTVVPRLPSRAIDLTSSCIFFAINDPDREMWRTDLTAEGTQRVSAAPWIERLGAGVPGRAFFSVFDWSFGVEPWTSDGIEEPSLLADLHEGHSHSSPEEFVTLGRRVFFTAFDENYTRQLWMTGVPPVLSINDATARERTGRVVNMVFEVRLSDPARDEARVDFAVEDGSARSGTDFRATTGTLRFAPGRQVQRVVVPVLGDLVREPAETFRVVLSNAMGAEVERSTAVGTIHDAAAQPVVRRPGSLSEIR